MKTSRFSEPQIAFALRQAEAGTSIAEVCRKAGISEATCYLCRKKCGGLAPSEMKRLKLLAEDNSKLKRIVADLVRSAAGGADLGAERGVRRGGGFRHLYGPVVELRHFGCYGRQPVD
jgi:putative transposase